MGQRIWVFLHCRSRILNKSCNILFFVYSRQDWLRSDARERAPGTESAGSGWRVTTDSYRCIRKALHHDVDDPTRSNSDPAIDLDADATEYLTEQLLLVEEKDFVTAQFSTGVWTGASSSTDMVGQAAPASTAANFRQWNDVASTPIEDIRGEMVAVARNTGKRPNKLALGAEVWTALADHPDILDRIKFTERGIVTTDLLASLLDLDEVLVSWAVEDSAIEQAAESMGFVAGKAALLAYAEPNPGIRKPSAGYTFVWTGMVGQPADGARIKRFRMESVESDRVEAERWYSHDVVSSVLGAFFASAVA